ncbi:hypothetical protein EDB81DRAFT_817534 [Dactylonectria macrodidyma]|uniref:Rhodopsin domain-containing protein n=1 Tax=Dactylonectria macrodidyma TaxID=307937 RepID=A0A9P9DFZ8_9HYPO|nr:hypothetical protein EDB81DRAFT_817534 [Dactylonectria macrodidyma]
MLSAPFWRRNDAVSLAPPPPGVNPNFVDPPTLDHLIIGYSVGCLAASSCFVLLRIYTFAAITKTRDWADYLLVPAWILAAIFSVLSCTLMIKYGFGRHAWDVPFSTFNNHFMKVGGITGTFYGMSIMLTKLSILAFYLRFVVESGKLRGIIYATMVITILYSIIASFVWVYACQPLEKYWDLTITDGSCINFLKVTIFSGVMNTVTDAIILLLPIMILWGLSMPKRQKIGVIMIMMTGGLVLGISIVRLRQTVASLFYRDFTWDSAKLIAWWTVEVHLALMCACLPSLKPFLRRLRSTVKTKYGTSDSAGGLIPQPIYLTSDSHLVPTRGGDEIPLQTSDEAACESKKKAALELRTTLRKASHIEEAPPLPPHERHGSLLV